SMMVQLEFRQRQSDIEAARVAAWQQQAAAYQAQREKQIALAAAAQGAREQARRDLQLATEYNKHQLAQQQALAQQNLILQAQLARQQNNYVQHVALLESAIAIQRTDMLVQQLAQARAELAVEQQKRAAAEQRTREAEAQRDRVAQVARIQPQLALAVQKQQEERATLLKSETTLAQAEYDRFIDLGKRSQESGNYAAAVSAFQNARRLKPSPEVEALVTAALNEQAKADALKKGDAERKKLEAQLAQEEQKRKQLEEQNGRLKVKYQSALVRAQDAMKERKYDDAVSSFRLASLTIQTDEAEAGLKQAQAELAKVRATADAEAKKKAEEEKKLADLQKRRTEARTALAARQYDKAIVSLRAAAAIKPDDVEVQKELTQAEQAQSEAVAAKRKVQEDQDAKAGVQKLVAVGQSNLKAKQYDAAIVAFTDALKLDATNKDAKAGLDQAQSAQKSIATDAAAQAEAKRKRDAYETAMRQGRAALGLKQYSDALGFFQKAQDLLPGDTASADLIKEATKQKGDTDTAASAQKKATELTQAIAAGRAALRGNKFDEAQAAADHAAKLSPDSAEVKKLAADIDTARRTYAATTQKKDDAKAAAEAEAKRKQSAYETAMRAAQTAMDARQYEEAIAKATEALRAKPSDPAATQLLSAARKADAAADAAAIEANKKQEAYVAAVREASAAYAAKKYESAIKSAKDALANKPGDATATKILTDAQKALEAANATAIDAKKKQETYDAAIKAGRTALAAKDYDAAVKAFNQALAVEPGDPTATALLKVARDAQSDAAGDAKKKQLFDAWMDRAEKLMAARRYEDAIEAYSTALRVFPGDPTATKGLATARTAAATPKKDPPKDPPKDPVPPRKDAPPKGDPNAAKVGDLLKIAASQEDSGKYADAYRTYQDILKLAPSNMEAKKRSSFCQWMDQGSRQLAAGKLSEAAVSFDQALKIDPSDENAKRMLQQAQAKPKKK
ncbi:MAG TPA: tetratricopeptide repeat protein, partial [Gemmataceae bacterium]|nr:tetratricopeptide repeat protein [Gemmataceae bacterium]